MTHPANKLQIYEGPLYHHYKALVMARACRKAGKMERAWMFLRRAILERKKMTVWRTR